MCWSPTLLYQFTTSVRFGISPLCNYGYCNIRSSLVVGVLTWYVGGQMKIVRLVVCRLRSLIFRVDIYTLRISLLLMSVSDVVFTMVPNVTHITLRYCECGPPMAKSIPGMLDRMSSGPR